MASPLLLALTASAALIAGPALACDGQACWGMAPAQALNPGYTGPDYSQYEGPGRDGYGPGPGADQDGGPGFDGGPPGPDRDAAMDDQRAYIGPIEGLADQQRARAYGAPQDDGRSQAYGYGAQPGYGPQGGPQGDPQGGPPDGYGDPQDSGSPDEGPAYGDEPPQGAGPQGVYGEPRDYSPSAPGFSQSGSGEQGFARQGYSAQGYGRAAQAYGPSEEAYGPSQEAYGATQEAYGATDEGEPPSAYAMARPAPGYGHDRYGESGGHERHWMHGGHEGPGPLADGWADAPPPPYQTYSHDGYQRYSHSAPSRSGYRSNSYRAGDVSVYDYDSGWVEDGAANARGGPGWINYPPVRGPDGPGAPPCAQCSGAH